MPAVKKPSQIEDMMKAARESTPDLWERTDQVARIIDPAAFMTDWIVHPEDRAKVLNSRLKYQQAIALSKAQAILRYLGVNTDADWMDILGRMAKH